MKKYFILAIIIILLVPNIYLFSNPSVIPSPHDITGKNYLTWSVSDQYLWCYGFLQGIGEVVTLLQNEYKDKTHLEFWNGYTIPIEIFHERITFFLNESLDAREYSLAYVGLLVVQAYSEKRY